MGSYSLLFLLSNNSFLIPLDRFPPFELDIDLIGSHVLEQVEIDKTIDSISSNIEGLIDLNKNSGHIN